MSGSGPIDVLVAVIALMIGGIFVEAIGDVLGLVIVVTGLTTVGLRSYVALTIDDDVKAEEASLRLERATAIGFYLGVSLSVLILVVDALVGG